MGDSQPQPVFSLRLVSIDYYMSPPIPDLDISYSSFHGGKVNEVPVIRIYGSTPSGQKTCLHIHRALPYLYIPCSDLGCITYNEVDSCMHPLSLALEKALKLKGNAGSKRQHVHGCDIVRARKFYGYHSSEELFVKIYLYYPQDVSRAANLLLTGAILDKNLQPHESHIPFLLQFMIDYNLYGMGHLHVSKMKFRYPVPDVFTQRKSKHNGEQRLSTDNSNCIDSQAGLVGDLCLNMPIWISSTIPDGWIWQYSHQSDSSTTEDIPFFKRHSTTELEGDAVIDDIINQQFISYASLSQSHSEVKMVQSLMPIWEEEYERNGVPEAIPTDPKKPSPQYVLQVLSDGMEFEKFMEVTDDVESRPHLTPESTASTECGDLVVSGNVDFENSIHLPSKYLKASDKNGSLLSLGSSFQNVDTSETTEIDAGDQPQTSYTVDPSSPKATDGDALRLLKWLASSQAAEDINSDDELAHETILSPLLPSKDIDKVLEIANVDYESESQKECQDILDSIDMLNSEESNLAKYNDSSKALSNKIIPQVDGSSDDLWSNEALKTDISEEKPYEKVHSWPELDPDLICEHRRKKPRWGSLPISCQKLGDDSHPNTSTVLTGCDNEKKGSFGTSSYGNEAERIPSVVKIADKKDVSYTEQDSVIAECSTRDLMRRKRSGRFELPERRSRVEDWNTELFSDTGCKKESINLDSKLSLDIQDKKAFLSPPHKQPLENDCRQCDESISSPVDVCNEVGHVKPTSKDSIEGRNVPKNENPVCLAQLDSGDNSCEYLHISVVHESSLHVSSCTPEYALKSEINCEGSGCRVLQTSAAGSCTVPSECDLLSKNACVSESGCQMLISTSKCPDIAHEDMKCIESDSTLMQFENSSYYGGSPGSAKLFDPLKTVNKESEAVKLVSMTFSKKPPTIEWTEEPGNETHVSLGNRENNASTSLQKRFSDNLLPFFMRSYLGKEELQGVSPRESGCIGNPESAVGVPVLYQHDGSHLFMLTHAVPPPSRESVERWMSVDGSDTLREKIDAVSPVPPISKGFSCDMVDSQGSQADFSNSPLPETGSLSDENPKSKQENSLSETKIKSSTLRSLDISQISGPDKNPRLTPLSQIGFRDPASVGQGQQLSLLSIEVQAESRGDLRPDPRFDSISVIVLVFQEDDDSILDTHVLLHCESAKVGKDLDAVSKGKVFVFSEELQLFNHFTKVIRASDPDILMGWDVQSGSLGFLAERASHLGLGLLNNISRTPSEAKVASRNSRASEKEMVKEIFSESVVDDAFNLENIIIEDEWGRTHASGVHVGGRIVLNVWRLMRNEVKLNMYTAEAVAETVLRRKIPYIPCKVLTKWFSSGPGQARHRSIDYTLERAKLNLQIMNQLDMINRTSELARVFGIDFFSVLSRGSQYRVESMFLRLAHTQNYLAISPGNQQVANQPAMECLPLVMEPESSFYADPVIVLDFQSLYPSMVIGYNLCFCTCLGKITPSKENILGVSSYAPDKKLLYNMKQELLVTPNGVVYVPSKVRKGILPRLLEEILSTRIMVKQAMKKLAPSQAVLRRILNARQLALKLIANVTYGYTAAGFSGRMPCAELADSIVQCGRRTLETAISFVNSNDKWKARVIYGDTDSMFVLLKGRSLKEAFAIGGEIASAITEMNPNPVTLKMEKVYFPCFLLTKKRYVGYSYESPDQSKPIFDAKGIETVRRDTCAAVSKTMEKSLRIYFESQNIDMVKAYMVRQWTRILSGRITLQDFIFAKEVRLGTYSARVSSLPPAAIVATKSMRSDPRAEPRYAERVPYVVVHGEPGARLVDMVVDPLELLTINSPFRLNDIYYIRKQIIPALQRVFGLVGADLNRWFLEIPRPGREAVGKRSSVANPQRTRIDYYYASKHCVVCGELVQGSAHICHECCKNETTVAVALTGRTSKLEKDMHHLAAICGDCGGGDWCIESGVKCISLACSVFYERRKVQKEYQSLSQVATTSGFYPKCMVEWF